MLELKQTKCENQLNLGGGGGGGGGGGEQNHFRG